MNLFQHLPAIEANLRFVGIRDNGIAFVGSLDDPAVDHRAMTEEKTNDAVDHSILSSVK